MSCIWCLDNCVKIELDDDSTNESKKEPIQDLVQVIEKIAWRKLHQDPPVTLTFAERWLCGIKKVCKLEVDKTFISIVHADTLVLHPKPKRSAPKQSKEETAKAADGLEHAPEISLAPPISKPQGQTFLFQSQFHNDTKIPQTYSFKTERETRSVVEMSMQRGFTLGQTLELDVKIPTGVKGCKVSGKLGGQMQWSFTRGKISRQEEHVAWSVDSHVQVSANTTGTATLAVQETRWTADFSLECLVRPRPIEDDDGDDSDSDDAGPTAVKFPVFVRRRTDGQLIKLLNIPRSDILDALPDSFKAFEQDNSSIVCTLQGECHSVCAVNQRVWLEEATFVSESEKPSFLHQDSVILPNN